MKNSKRFLLQGKYESSFCFVLTPEVKPGQHPAQAAAGSSQPSRFLSGEPSQVSSPAVAG